MRPAPAHPRCDRPRELRRRIERLGGLPLRPTTARALLSASLAPIPLPPCTDIDPGWALTRLASPAPAEPLQVVADRPWWPGLSTDAAGAVQRLWRHAVAASCAARRLALEAGDPDPDGLAALALLHRLGEWALAAIEPERLALLLALDDPRQRLERERAWLGRTAAELGRALAEAWCPSPALADAAWLHHEGDRGLAPCASDPARLALLQQAVAWAERTPWALNAVALKEPAGPGSGPGSDPRLKRLVAEVQARCGPAFVEPATPTEEQFARDNARLLLQVRELREGQAARDRLILALARSQPAESPEAWAERAEQAWAGTPGVTAAQLCWADEPEPEPAAPASTQGAAPEVVSLVHRGRSIAEVRLWTGSGAAGTPRQPGPVVAAWSAWAAAVADRAGLVRRLEAAAEAHRLLAERDGPARLAERLAALAEFAAGAGHELNNPLAVIVGRAQLLLAQQRDGEAARSLRAIIGQAQRAHRILRDLMYVARPAAPRPRACQPDEVVRSCLRDLQAEAEARGVRLLAEAREPAPVVWADPEPIRHVTETLARNALEATPPGGTVRLTLESDSSQLRWTVHDTGKGLTPAEAEHLFDPFFCGRQAGRGLGLGLPRVARYVEQQGGQIRWRSAPGRGTTFHLSLPLDPAPSAGGSGPVPFNDACAGTGPAR